MTNVKRIQQVTANYFLWQGLRFIPFGLLFLLGAIGFLEQPLWPYTVLPSEGVLLIATLLAFVAFQGIGTYYERTFGRVQGAPGIHRRRNLVKWWVVYPAVGVSLILDWMLQGPLFFSGIVWAVAVLAYWWSTGRGRMHYLVAVTVLACFTFFPAFHLVAPGKPIFVLFYAIVGVTFILGGLLDHRELTKFFASIQEQTHERSL